MNLPPTSSLAKDDHAFLKTTLSFSSIEGVKKRIKENGLFIAKSKGIAAEDKLNEIGDRILKNFGDDIKTVSSKVKATLIRDCDPIDYTQTTQMMFFSFIEKQVARYLINNPDNEGFKRNWNIFRLDFAIRRHLPSEFVKMTINYLDLIRNEMMKMNQKLLKDEVEREDRLWNAFKVILDKDFDLLDIPVAILAGKATYSDDAFIDTNAKQLLESSNQSVQMFIQNFPWVFRTCRIVLSPFNHMSYSKNVIEKIENFEKNCLPKFPILFRKEISSSWESNKAIIGVIAEGIQSFCQIDSELQNSQLDNPSEDISELENFQKVRHFCDMILNIYLKVPFYNFIQIWAKIYSWHENLNEDDKKKLEKLEITWLSDFIQGEKPGESKRKKRQRQKSQPQPIQTLNSTIDAPTDRKPEQVQEVLPVPLYDKILQALKATIKESQNPNKKDAARHAFLYLEDLLAAQDALKKTTESSARLFYLLTILHSAYYHLEQILHFHIDHGTRTDNVLSGNSGHHLELLLQESNLDSKIKKTILSELFLANYWVFALFEQYEKRSKWNRPGCLHEIKKIYEDENYRNQPSTIEKINSYFQRVINFTGQIPLVKTLPENNLAKNAMEPFKHNIQIEPNKYDQISEVCKGLIKKFPYWSSKLRQVSYRLEIVKGILQEIRNPIISSQLFSLLVRGLIFWEHSAFEGLLQALYGIKTGIETYSHDLPFLYQQSIHSEKQRKDLLFLNQDLNDVHNLVRYPFSPGNGSESKRNLILQAELFRECPELGMEQQFELQCDKTSLNYLKVKREDTPAEIIKKLNETSQKIIKMIDKRMIPEFNSAV